MTRSLDPESEDLLDALKAHAERIRHSERQTVELVKEGRSKGIPWADLEEATGLGRKWLGKIGKGRQRTKRGTVI